jgi:hypothetical protein
MAATTGNQCDVAPAAFSAQITGNSSLLNAAGVCYVGRMGQALPATIATDSRTAATYAAVLLAYAKLRTCSNSELVSSPKQINAIPTDLSELQDFAPFQEEGNTVTGYSHMSKGITAFAPIVIINHNLASLQVTICVEWRVRFDPFSPMATTGTMHEPTHPSVWHSIMNAAHTAGHGVEEVAMNVGSTLLADAIGGIPGMIAGFAGNAISGAMRNSMSRISLPKNTGVPRLTNPLTTDYV